MKDKKGNTLWFDVKMGETVLTSFIPTNETKVSDMLKVEEILNRMSGRSDFGVTADWKKKDGLFKATWDDQEGFVMHGYGETREEARARIVTLLDNIGESGEELLNANKDYYSVKQVAERDDEEG